MESILRTPGRRTLILRSLLTFAVAILLPVMGQVVIQIGSDRRANHEYFINLSGRQRMLSQRLSKTALILTGGLESGFSAQEIQQRTAEMRQALKDWQAAYVVLTTNQPGELAQRYTEQAPYYKLMVVAAACIVDRAAASCPQPATAYLQQLLANEPSFLSVQERIVAIYQEQAVSDDQLWANVRWVFTLLQVVAFLMMAVFFVFPSIKQVTTAQELLAKSNEQQRLLTENVSDLLTEYSPQGVISYASPSATVLTGYQSEELIGHNVLDFMNPDDAEILRYVIANFGPNQDQARFNYPLRRKDGSYAWFETTARAIRNPNTKEITSVVAIARDVTERNEADKKMRTQNAALVKSNRELAQARRQAEEAMRLKSEFVATISHELRTPLNAVIGYSEIILAGMAGDIAEEALGFQDRILVNAKNLLSLINDILDLSKIEAGRIEIQNNVLNIHDLLRTVVYQTKGIADSKGLDYQINIAPDVPAEVIGDVERIRQILINLVSNAIKFTEKGRVDVQVARVEDKRWSIAVIDTGIGIPLHAQNYIFDEFRQADGSTEREYGGTGLGLAIVRKLVLLMNGTIQLKSAPGEGSTFTVILPLRIPSAELVAATAKSMGAAKK